MTTTEGLPDATSIQQKLLQTSQLYNFSYTLKKTQIERQYPEWTEKKVHEHIIDLIHSGSH